MMVGVVLIKLYVWAVVGVRMGMGMGGEWGIIVLEHVCVWEGAWCL